MMHISDALLESYIQQRYFLSMYSVIRQAYFDRKADQILKRFKSIVKMQSEEIKAEWRVWLENNIHIIRAEWDLRVQTEKDAKWHAARPDGKKKRSDTGKSRIPDWSFPQ